MAKRSLKVTIDRDITGLLNTISSVWTGERVFIYAHKVEDFFKVFGCCKNCLVKSMCIDIEESPLRGPDGERETEGKQRIAVTDTCEKFEVIRKKIRKLRR